MAMQYADVHFDEDENVAEDVAEDEDAAAVDVVVNDAGVAVVADGVAAGSEKEMAMIAVGPRY